MSRWGVRILGLVLLLLFLLLMGNLQRQLMRRQRERGMSPATGTR